ncbi:MAG: GNAT family N-acetyltransferase [Spirochaetota bacterium]
MIRLSVPADFNVIHEIINDAAAAYKGIIPADRWHEPYMPKEELMEQIHDGVAFYCCVSGDSTVGVMGMQDKGNVNLIRHAYVRTSERNKGIGGILLEHLKSVSEKPILIGTWASASWAVRFYQKHGFTRVSDEEKNLLLKKYWNIPQRQIETSVVLADQQYFRIKSAHDGK